MAKDDDGSAKATAGDGPASGDRGKGASGSRKPRRRPVSERILDEIEVDRRVALEILANR